MFAEKKLGQANETNRKEGRYMIPLLPVPRQETKMLLRPQLVSERAGGKTNTRCSIAATAKIPPPKHH